MTWLPLLGTLLGAVIALGSAFGVERLRQRREDRTERRKSKQDLYGRFLGAYAHTRAQLRIIAETSGLSDEERANRARVAYAGCYAPRYEMEVLAPQSVLTPVLEFDQRAKALRDRVIEGTKMHTQGKNDMREYLDSLKIVRTEMRADLGASENT